MSIFTQIKRGLIRAINESDVTGIEDYSFSVKSKWYPTYVINWFYKQGLFKVASVETVTLGKGYKQYIVTVKEIDLENKLFKNSGVRGRLTKETTDNTEFGYYSTGRIDQASFYADESRYEHVALEDHWGTDLAISEILGFTSYRELIEVIGETEEAYEMAKSAIEEYHQGKRKREFTYDEVEA